MKRLLDDLNTFEGNVLCIDVKDKKILSKLKKNKQIGVYELARPEKRKLFFSRKRAKISSDKSVNIKKFRKIFKKKSIDYIIVDGNNIYDYFKYIPSNCMYTCNKKVYIYGESEYVDSKAIATKFARYKTKIERIQIENEYLVIVDCSNAKYSRIKEWFYVFIDTFINLGDMISYLLTS